MKKFLYYENLITTSTKEKINNNIRSRSGPIPGSKNKYLFVEKQASTAQIMQCKKYNS